MTELTIKNLFPMVANHKGQAVTTSLDVAEFFGKRHDNVLQAIEKLDCSDEFNALNFQVVKYKDEKGEKRPMVRMTRDGFTFLAMGFRGAKAAKFKEAYIKRFNEMEQWITIRQKLKSDDSLLGEAIQYREQMTGKKPDQHVYAREHNLIYCVAIGSTRKKWLHLHDLPNDDDIRQHLNGKQLALIDRLTAENAMMIKLEMDYTARKTQLEKSALHYWQHKGASKNEGYFS